ncbi:hypothetical protein K2Z84_33805 [Candidatus Binatia bacterium]|jgi:hypothetical protein|nr:hypothetical protein [Candidatus Binatia bacterium]
MAKPASQRTQRSARDQDARLRQLTILDTLKGWTIPLIALGIALAAWPASIAGILDTVPALEIAAACLLIAALHAGVAEFFDERTTAATAATLVAFGLLYGFTAWTPLADKLNPGAEVFSGDLKLHGETTRVPLGGQAGNYRVVVEGRLGESTEHATRSAHYQVNVASDGAAPQILENDFTDRWSQRRSGRRGVSTVHVSHTAHEYGVSSPNGSDLQLSLASLTPGAHDMVSVKVYRDTFITPLFVGLGVALTAAAMVIDFWRYTDSGDLMLTSVTLGALLAVASFRRFAPPHPGFGDLAFNGAVGAIAGVIAGRILARVAHAVHTRNA